MGLMTQMQDDAERLVRQEKNLNRGYQHSARQLKAEAAPHEQVVKDYNTQVEGFKQSAVHRADNDALWQIIGWATSMGGPQVAVDVTPNNWAPVRPAEGNPDLWGGGTGQKLYSGVYSGTSYAGDINQPVPNTWGVPQYPGYLFKSQNGMTLRNAAGTPINEMSLSPNIQMGGLDGFYATYNDRPFVAPVTKDQEAAATSADAVLSGIGERGEAMKTEHSKAAGLIGTRADRLALDSEMMQNQAREAASPQASVFDQNLTVFQSIVDWLK